MSKPRIKAPVKKTEHHRNSFSLRNFSILKFRAFSYFPSGSIPSLPLALPKAKLSGVIGDSKSFSFPGFGPRLNLRDQALFARRLALLVRAGVPILESLTIMREQARSRRSAKMFDHILKDVTNGRELSRSLAHFKGVFGEFAINIIKVGESSGTLSENLTYLASEVDKERELKRKIVGAMIYPIIIVLVTVAVASLLTVYLFPKLLPIFRSLKVNLPFSTRALLWTSDFLIHYGAWVLGGLIALFIASIFLLRMKSIRRVFDRALIEVPIIGSIFQDYQLTNLCRTLGLLLKGSLTVLEATKITGDTVTNLAYREQLKMVHRTVAKGGTISSELEKKKRLFPAMIAHMVAIGEKTGNLSDTLNYLAEIYEQDLDEKTKRLSTVIEPALMIVMGLVVGFVAISIITPIYEITQHLNP